MTLQTKPRDTRIFMRAAFSDPRSALRTEIVPSAPLRAKTQQLVGRRGMSIPSNNGMCAEFTEARTALEAALTILKEVTLSGLDTQSNTPVAVRIVLDCSDTHPETWNAMRGRMDALIGLSREHTLLIGRSFFKALPSHQRDFSRPIPVSDVVGLDYGPNTRDGLYEFDWRAWMSRANETTGTLTPNHAVATLDERLELSYAGLVIEISAKDCPFSLGRDKKSGLAIDSDVASRNHARIEYTNQNFYFSDISRNGSYLLTPQGEEVFVHQDRMPLLGRGVISLGAPIIQQTGEVLRYTCLLQESEPASVPISTYKPIE